jgi:hypothetical protein
LRPEASCDDGGCGVSRSHTSRRMPPSRSCRLQSPTTHVIAIALKTQADFSFAWRQAMRRRSRIFHKLTFLEICRSL